MRSALTRLFRLVLRIFFRDIEIVGEERVPDDAPVIFVSNHPNALIDPVFLLCLSPREVSFLAKEPLFRTPVISAFVKAFGSLPVYRKQDGADPKDNRKTIDACRAALGAGRAIALFPEGTTHSDSRLKPLKTGAARIALSANASGGRRGEVRIVPAGLYYSDKRTFRSRASLVYGEPIDVPTVSLDDNAEPPRDDAVALTSRIDEALGEVTVQAGTHDARELARAAERIFAAAERDEGGEARTSGVFAEMDLMRRLIDGYEALRGAYPDEVARVASRVKEYDARITRHGLSHRHPSELTFSVVLGYAASTLVGLIALAPLALPAAILNYLPYRLVGFVTTRSAKAEEVVATFKVLGALLFFPLTWIVVTAVVAAFVDPWVALAILVASPIAAFAALVFSERTAELLRGARLLALAIFRPTQRDLLVRERRAIRDEILRLADRL
jgi:1-acyl-sn-glycerol-3-phosphate acyltransferase